MCNRLCLKSLICFFFLLSILSCKKDKVDPDKPKENANRTELTKDSIFLYAKEVYLWNTALPSYAVFNPRSFTKYGDEFENYQDELLKITRYTDNERWYSSGGVLYDDPKYSYIEEAQNNGVIARFDGEKSYVELDGWGDDIGLGLAYIGSNNNYYIFVKYVNPGSPAAAQKIKRGSIITKVNGRSYGSNFDAEIDDFLDATDAASVTLTLYPPSSSVSQNVSLNKVRYKSSPIFKDTVYVRNADNIGYLAYARFSEKDDSEPALNGVFERFASKNVNKLIVDLRYNGGGYVSSAEKLINLIIPYEYNGQLLFTEKYNETMRTGKATILKNQFYTVGGVKKSYYGSYTNIKANANKSASGYLTNIRKVVFIVSGGTASASELTINALKPYIDVKLVGEKTYGKPVGFFSIRIDKYDVYYSMFVSFNSRDEGGYYNGMSVDKAVSDYPYNKELGDPAESNTAAAIDYLMNGSFSASVQSRSGAGEATILSNPRSLNKDGFKGMIERPERIFK